MVMSEQAGGGLAAMHQLGPTSVMHPHRAPMGGVGGVGLVQPSLVMNPHNHPIMGGPHGDSCSMEQANHKPRRLSHCVGCGGQIHDQYILRVAPDLEWHAACLRCQECQQFLDETCTCFVRDGKTYCKRDYVKLFGTKCDKCGSSFSKNDFVMRAKSKIYHIECFRCCACARQLVPGDEFALRDGNDLYCKSDHDVMTLETKSSSGPNTPSHNNNNNNSSNNNNNNTNNNNNNNTREESNNNTTTLNHNSNSTELGCMSDSGSESGSHKGGGGGGGGGSGGLRTKSGNSGGGGGGGGSDGKPTRVRTVLNEKQLHTLRTCYAANPRPDALMKEQLVEMTGLSPRVIRVWFQNKRCKDKKKTILMKQQMQQEKFYVHANQDGRKLGYGAMQGIPMVASSPVRHDSPSLGNVHALEVQAYQPPWKALTEFALHADLDHASGGPHPTAFQQLVNQMHGYDLPPPAHMNMGLGGGGGPPPLPPGHPPPTTSMLGGGGGGGGMSVVAPPSSDAMTHPDSTDSYVTYLDSDESLPPSPP